MGRRSKRAAKTRHAAEFDKRRLSRELRTPDQTVGDGTWTLPQALAARDAQLRGDFRNAARLARVTKTDSAIYTAHENRLAPQRCIGVELQKANSTAKAGRVQAEGDALYGPEGIGIHPDSLNSINAELADHGVAFGVVHEETRDDGSRVDLIMKHWPVEFVRWDPLARTFLARVDHVPEEEAAAHPEIQALGYQEVPIVHGDGRWVVFSKHEHEPWKYGCLVASTLVWAVHSTAVRDWAKGSTAHGNAKVVGEMPEGMALVDSKGEPTDEAASFLELLKAIASLESPVGIQPAGAKTDYITNSSTAWQVWEQLSIGAEKAAARIYLGTDGTMGAQGGAPGVDIAALFGVATTKVQSDLGALERGITTGVIEPWAAMNFGDSSLAPKRIYLIPDPDAQAMRDEYAKNAKAFQEDVKRQRENGFVLPPRILRKLAKQYGIEPPLSPEGDTSAPSIELAPTDLAAVVRVNEARASAKLPPLALPDGSPDPDGDLFVEQFRAKHGLEAAPPVRPPQQ